MASAYTSNGTPSYDDPASKPLFGETRPKASKYSIQAKKEITKALVTGQTLQRRRLVCAFVAPKSPKKGLLMSNLKN